MARAKKKASASKKTASRKSASGTEVPVKTKTAEPAASRMPAPWGDIERLFDDFLERRLGHPFRLEWPTLRGRLSAFEQRVPTVDIVDRNKEVVVRAEVPGIDKEDITVSIDDRMLTIKGSSRHEEKKEEEDYYRHEIRSGTFSRSVLLPTDVDVSKAKATFKNGVVELHLPKVRASKPQQISVS